MDHSDLQNVTGSVTWIEKTPIMLHFHLKEDSSLHRKKCQTFAQSALISDEQTC